MRSSMFTPLMLAQPAAPFLPGVLPGVLPLPFGVFAPVAHEKKSPSTPFVIPAQLPKRSLKMLLVGSTGA